MDLPKPTVKRCYFERRFEPPLAAMELTWDLDAPGAAERIWYFPDGLVLKGAAPSRFGVTIHRHGKDSYEVRIAWNRICLSWDTLTRAQIMTSSLAIILHSVGTDLWYLLEQAVESKDRAA